MPTRPVTLALLLSLATPILGHAGIGTDLASLNICLYGDCEARGSYAADPYGVYNPAVMTVGAVLHMPRGGVLSGSYYHLGIGALDADVGVGVTTFAWAPFTFQVATAYADAHGGVRPLPGIDMTYRTRAVRLAAAVDGERTLGLRGLSLGLAGIVPGTTSDVRLSAGGVTFVRSAETRDLELIPGLHWHGGEADWLMFGAFLDVLRNDVESNGVDPTTGTLFHRSGTSNVWFARVGTSLLPLVPLGLARGDAPGSQWGRELRLGIDIEYRNLAIPGEPSVAGATAFFGVDAPLVPDAWNPLARWVRPWVLGGVDTRGGWGVGGGLYGQGPLAFLSCNQAYSSRPLTQFLGDRVDVFAITCSAVIPL